MAEVRINATGGLKLYDADDSHYAQILAGTISSNVDALTLGSSSATFGLPVTVGEDDTGHDVKLFGATASRYWLWDESADGVVQRGTLTVGVDDTGHDVKLFGAYAGAYMEWDESEDQLRIMGASADATTSTGKLLLATSLTDINANDVIGKIEFQAPHEAGGTDAITVAASIQAVAQSTFTSSSNATDLIFNTGHSEAAAEKIRFTSQNEIGIAGANYGTDGQVLTSGGAGAAVAWEDAGGGGASAINDLSDAKTLGTSSIMLGDATTGVINAANYNTGFGVDVFDDLTEGDSNVSIGYQSGYELTTGGSNTFVGTNAGRVVVSGAENVAIGKDAYLAGTASNNVVVGTDAMKATTSGTQQVAVGKAAMQSNTTGNYNTAFGAYAGQDNAQGSNNTYIGYQAGKDINYTSGEQASENTFVGYQAGHQLTTPSRGTYVGRGAGGNMIQGPTHQTAVGMYSLYGHYGTYSTGVGYGCYQTGSGAYLAGLGYGHSCTGASSIHIGYNISDNTSNQINMGGGSTYITCDYSSGSSWSGGSDERMKKDITTATLGLSFINDLRPVTFKWKAPSEFPTSWETYSPPTYVNSLGDTIEQETEPQSTDTVHGLVAQEVKTALDTAGVSTFSGWSERDGGQQCISKEMFVIPLINAVNELTTRLEAAEAKITALESE